MMSSAFCFSNKNARLLFVFKVLLCTTINRKLMHCAAFAASPGSGSTGAASHDFHVEDKDGSRSSQTAPRNTLHSNTGDEEMLPLPGTALPHETWEKIHSFLSPTEATEREFEWMEHYQRDEDSMEVFLREDQKRTVSNLVKYLEKLKADSLAKVADSAGDRLLISRVVRDAVLKFLQRKTRLGPEIDLDDSGFAGASKYARGLGVKKQKANIKGTMSKTEYVREWRKQVEVTSYHDNFIAGGRTFICRAELEREDLMLNDRLALTVNRYNRQVGIDFEERDEHKIKIKKRWLGTLMQHWLSTSKVVANEIENKTGTSSAAEAIRLDEDHDEQGVLPGLYTVTSKATARVEHLRSTRERGFDEEVARKKKLKGYCPRVFAHASVLEDEPAPDEDRLELEEEEVGDRSRIIVWPKGSATGRLRQQVNTVKFRYTTNFEPLEELLSDERVGARIEQAILNTSLLLFPKINSQADYFLVKFLVLESPTVFTLLRCEFTMEWPPSSDCRFKICQAARYTDLR
ncbi:unnamed protein product [Amoebophrya sp. A120]|nr:unnamed protein product [Amoebophrya sp. A120]|eukprot:GSA120T00008249001.1